MPRRLLPHACLLLGVLVLLSISIGAETPAPAADAPRVLDDRLVLTLFAEAPDVVTPIGLAAGPGGLYVLESHTHTPPHDYDGPSHDRVKVLVDRDGDGRADAHHVFAGGIEDGMNLAFGPDGALYVVTSRSVLALHDRDGDGVSEARSRVLTLDPPGDVYDHAGLLGITFGPDGWMYVTRGNTGGQAWRLSGTDGSAVEGYGDGGNVVRARPDGTALEEVATGFWNPFDLTFDAYGRLLAADNDPDSRGPNRLVHVVPGGDYGYRSLYGGSGIHPYLAWNGERPGTLPYAAGLGEAPSGLLDASDAALPPDYRDAVLVTIWEESRITRTHLTPHGASVRGATDVLVEGGPDFRPVALAADAEGAVYVSDWVLRQYPNHGQGRIWRLAARPGVDVAPPRATAGSPRATGAAAALEHVLAATPADTARLRDALLSPDPFLRAAAVGVLARPDLHAYAARAARDARADVRLGAAVALERGGHADAVPLVRRLLQDPDERVRRAALVGAGRAGLVDLADEIDAALDAEAVSADLFETYLATVRHLQPRFVEAYRARAERYAKDLERALPPGFVEALVEDEDVAPGIRAAAVVHLGDPAAHAALLVRLLAPDVAPRLRLEAVRQVGTGAVPGAGDALLAVARDPAAGERLRAEALLALGRQSVDASGTALSLLADPAADVRVEAARLLRSRGADADALRRAHASAEDAAVRAQLALALGEPLERPGTPAAWRRVLAEGGDPARGRRVFFAANAACASCHVVDGRGGDLGPDLTHVGRSKSRSAIVRAILDPSAEISPEWQAWSVTLADGSMHHGRQIDVGERSVELLVAGRGFVTFPRADIVAYGPASASLMPSGLDAALTVDDLRDLVAFLSAER